MFSFRSTQLVILSDKNLKLLTPMKAAFECLVQLYKESAGNTIIYRCCAVLKCKVCAGMCKHLNL